MNNQNIKILKYKIQNIKITLIVSLFVVSLFYVGINISVNTEDFTKATTIAGTTENSLKSVNQIPTSVATLTTMDSKQQLASNNYVMNYINAWKLSEVI